MYLVVIWIVMVVFMSKVNSEPDFSLTCRPGYRVSSIRRYNSVHQRNKAGSLAVECQPLGQPHNSSKIKCEKLASTPQCNGWPEGCHEQQWLAGFHVYGLENTTNVSVIDPVCCESPEVKVDIGSCATERLNEAGKAFEHTLLLFDLVYRGMQCWHQYNAANTVVDMVWKLEICQCTLTPSLTPTNNSLNRLQTVKHASRDNCPVCECHCGIDVCRDGKEPVRIIHKTFPDPAKCSCHCSCTYRCL